MNHKNDFDQVVVPTDSELVSKDDADATPGGQELVVSAGERLLSAEQFHQLSDVPAAMVWLANIDNANTRRAYESDVNAFVLFCGVETPAELRIVTRAHIIAWRGVLEAQELAPATIRRKLSAVSSLFDYLCNENAVEHNPVSGVKRPSADNNEGKTPPQSPPQAQK